MRMLGYVQFKLKYPTLEYHYKVLCMFVGNTLYRVATTQSKNYIIRLEFS